MAHPLRIAPSILSADFARLAEELADIGRAGADLVHVDVMDGQFVPNLTLGAPIVAALKRVSPLPLDCHLMVETPERLIEAFARAGAAMISVHVEAGPHICRTLAAIRSLGVQAGVALNPATAFAVVEPSLAFADFALIMSVNPGFGGQRFLPEVLDRVRAIDSWRRQHCPELRLEIDGGIDAVTAGAAAAAGADILVAGSAVFGQPDRAAAIASLRRAAAGAGRD